MDIVDIDPKILIPYGKNAKKHDKVQIKDIATSIKKYGFKQPVLVDKDNVIVVGHGRILGALQLKLQTVPCLIADDLTDEQIKEYRILDNKLNESDWDLDLLSEELNVLDLSDFELDFDFDLDEEEDAEPIEDGFDVEQNIPNEPTTKLGDIWQLGRHRLMCADCTDSEHIKLLMDEKLADLVVTDPPYNVNNDAKEKLIAKLNKYGNKRVNENINTGIANDNMSNDTFSLFLYKIYSSLNDNLKHGGALYIFHAQSEAPNFMLNFQKFFKLKAILIWVKNHFALSTGDYHWKHEPIIYGWKEGATHYFTEDRTQNTVFEDKIDLKKLKKEEMLENIYKDTVHTTVLHEDKPLKNDLHPTMKPIKLLARLIKNSSRENEIVLDTFGGSGSTLIACEQTNRICYMSELEPKYVDVIINRWEQFTGEKAALLESEAI